MKDWDKDLSVNAKEQMKAMGGYSPTVNAAQKMLKGYAVDVDGEPGKSYLDSGDLFKLGQACIEVAAWLEERAKEND